MSTKQTLCFLGTILSLVIFFVPSVSNEEILGITTDGQGHLIVRSHALQIQDQSGQYLTNIWTGNSTHDRLFTLPDKNGTIAMLSDVTGGIGLTSINGDVTLAQLINGVPGNTTVATSLGTTTINLSWNAITAGGSAQTITKSLTLNSLILGGNLDSAGFGFTISGHKGTLPSNTGTFLYTNGSLAGLTGNLNSNGGTFTGTCSACTISGTTAGSPTFSGNLLFTGNNNFQTGNNQFANLLLENPAKTFDTKLVGGAVTANRTLNGPVLTQTETIAVQPQKNFTASSNKTGTASLTVGVMLGDGITLTPRVTGNVEVSVSGYTTQNTAADGCVVQVRQGTNGSPPNLNALVGTAFGSNIKSTHSATTTKVPFSITVQITGLTVGTKIWLELSEQAMTGGTCTVNNVNWAVKEL